MLRSILMSALIALASLAEARADDLPSWTDGPVKQAVVEFVTAATTEGSPGWIAPTDRIATFDNDGTLWAEKPMYFQAMFVMDRVRALAPEHPDWATTQPFKAVLEGDMWTMVIARPLAASGPGQIAIEPVGDLRRYSGRELAAQPTIATEPVSGWADQSDAGALPTIELHRPSIARARRATSSRR